MKGKIIDVPTVVPPALDADETELKARADAFAERDDDFDDFAESDADLLDESDAAPGGSLEQQEAAARRRANARRSILFVAAFGAGFLVFATIVCWFFEVGFFAQAQSVAVDRNQSGNASLAQTASVNDEKLKTALQMVAADANNNSDSPVVTDATNDLSGETANSSSGERQTDGLNNVNTGNTTGNMIVLPDERSSANNAAAYSIRSASPATSAQKQPVVATEKTVERIQSSPANAPLKTNEERGDNAVARSVFFGAALSDKNNSNLNPAATLLQTVGTGSNVAPAANAPNFGTLLPVRLLGAVYTLRGAGGLVRMELTRAARGRGFSYPAGTIVVGNLRGSEYNRAFVSIVGVIDPKSGALVKFEGDVMGVDGASGIIGERKSVKTWGARFLRALREAGGQAVNVLTARSSRGGTIVIDSTNGIGGETAAIIRGDKNQENSFVVVRAGTEGYVMVTDLPGEINVGRNLQTNAGETVAGLSDANRTLPGVGLSSAEMAELLTTEDAQTLRDALLKMSPEFRRLAVTAMRDE